MLETDPSTTTHIFLMNNPSGYGIIKKCDIIVNPTNFDPIALEQWCSDEENSKQFESLFETYLHNYACAFPKN